MGIYRMKIALFAETYLPFINGVVTHISILRDGLIKLGHEVLVVAADPKAKHHYIEDGVLHCPAHKSRSKRFYGYGLANPISRTRLKILKEFDPDILHIHQEFGLGLFAAKAADRLGNRGAVALPVFDAVHLEDVVLALLLGVVRAENLDEAPVAGRTRIRRDDAERRSVVATGPAKTNCNHVSVSPVKNGRL